MNSNLTNAIDSIVSGPFPGCVGSGLRKLCLPQAIPVLHVLINFASSQDVISPDVAVSFLPQILK